MKKMKINFYCVKIANFILYHVSIMGQVATAREPSTVRQFIRHTAPCGSYYDQPVPFAHEVLCDYCHQPADRQSVVADKKRQICPQCITTGRVKQCVQCGDWVSQALSFLQWHHQSRFGDRVYCDRCKPPIVFTFKIGAPFMKDVTVPIPVKNEMGLPASYFYHAIANELQLDVRRLSIANLMGPFAMPTIR